MQRLISDDLSDRGELPEALECIAGRLDRAGIPRESVTLTLDETSDALTHALALDGSGLGWIAALPWDHAPPELRQRPLAQLVHVGPAQPGVRAVAARCLVHGTERLCVLQHSAIDFAEQLRSVTGALAKALRCLERLESELAEPQQQLPPAERVHQRAREALAHDHLPELLHYELTARDDRWNFRFQHDPDALARLCEECLGRTVLITNRDDWSAAEVVEAYGQQYDEWVSKGLKEATGRGGARSITGLIAS